MFGLIRFYFSLLFWKTGYYNLHAVISKTTTALAHINIHTQCHTQVCVHSVTHNTHLWESSAFCCMKATREGTVTEASWRLSTLLKDGVKAPESRSTRQHNSNTCNITGINDKYFVKFHITADLKLNGNHQSDSESNVLYFFSKFSHLTIIYGSLFCMRIEIENKGINYNTYSDIHNNMNKPFFANLAIV